MANAMRIKTFDSLQISIFLQQKSFFFVRDSCEKSASQKETEKKFLQKFFMFCETAKRTNWEYCQTLMSIVMELL